jgi:nicotinamide phosphoribosyltransferase
MNNIILMSDSYKYTHYLQYPEKTEVIYSYLESRGGVYGKTLFFGLQYLLKKYLCGEVVTLAKINEAEKIINSHLGVGTFNREGWEYILKEHNGYLPVKIKAVPEGMLVPFSNVLVTIENTDPKCFWLTNFLETLLVQVWYPITVATQSYYIKQNILRFLEETGTPSLIDFKLHDFGFRGVSSVESAGIGGIAHLVNFKGTDTVEALVVGSQYYSEDCAGYSIPASEHSTITSWGKDNEVEAYKNMLEKYDKYPLIACVSDSYNIYNACEELWGTQLKEQVMNHNGTLVIRPDSGNPVEVIIKVLNILWEKFGGEVNTKGYKVLDSHVRIIQGDGVNPDSIYEILFAMKEAGFSADNIAFGMGGALLQKLDRDTQKFAFKCSAIKRGGEWNDVFKSPITDIAKESKKGRLKLIKLDSDKGEAMHTMQQNLSDEKDLLVEVFNNGNLLVDCNLEEIRSRANENRS